MKVMVNDYFLCKFHTVIPLLVITGAMHKADTLLNPDNLAILLAGPILHQNHS